MTTAPLPGHASPVHPSQNLLGAALAGLLCLATSACATKADAPGDESPSNGGSPAAAGAAPVAGTETGNGAGNGAVAGAGGAAPFGNGGTSSSITAGAPPTGGDSGASVAGAPGAGGAADVPAEPPHITSSQKVGALTLESFTALCDERSGTVEVMPHCGGFATAKGFSYDSTTQLLSEHTCMGANTCAGWNCAIPD